MTYIRIEPRGAAEIGVPHVVTDDRLIFVDDSDAVDVIEIDISSAVRGYTISSNVGEARVVTLELLRVEIAELEHPPTPRLTDAQKYGPQ